MSTPTFLVPGFIPTTGIYSASELDSMVSASYPTTGYGFVYKASTAPDTITYPILKYFLWIDTTDNQVKVYDDATLSWIKSPIANNSLNGSVLIDGSVAITKLDPGVGNAGKVARVNGAGTAVGYDTPLNLYASNSFPIAKLVKGANDTVLITDGTGTVAWVSQLDVANQAEIPAGNLLATTGANDKVLGQSAGAQVYQYVETWMRDKQTPIAKLLPGTGGYVAVTADDGSLVQWTSLSDLYTKLVAAKYYSTAVAGYQAIGTVINFAHGLGSIPRSFRVVLVCQTGDVAYSTNDEIDVCSIFTAGGTAVCTTSADATYVSIRMSSATIQVCRKDTGAAGAITNASWKLKAYANL